MQKSKKRFRPKVMFAAPIVVTAAFAPGCTGRTYYNPGPPEKTATAEPTETAAPEASASAASTTSASAEALRDAPVGDGGSLAKQPDGTCLWVYPEPKMDCPPTATCNPGPPMPPLRVKCPDEKKP